MKQTDYTEVYETALLFYEVNDVYAKQFFTAQNLALWFLTIYMMYDQCKVITTRLVEEQDFSIIVSHYKMSAIWNNQRTHSWAQHVNMIEYEDLDADLAGVTEVLDFVLRRVIFNATP